MPLFGAGRFACAAMVPSDGLIAPGGRGAMSGEYRHNGPVATSSAIPASRLHGQHDRPSMVSVGTIVWLASELMFFAALFAAYFTIRSVSADTGLLWAQETAKLNVAFASVNTTVLVL